MGKLKSNPHRKPKQKVEGTIQVLIEKTKAEANIFATHTTASTSLNKITS